MTVHSHSVKLFNQTYTATNSTPSKSKLSEAPSFGTINKADNVTIEFNFSAASNRGEKLIQQGQELIQHGKELLGAAKTLKNLAKENQRKANSKRVLAMHNRELSARKSNQACEEEAKQNGGETLINLYKQRAMLTADIANRATADASVLDERAKEQLKEAQQYENEGNAYIAKGKQLVNQGKKLLNNAKQKIQPLPEITSIDN